MSLDVVRRRMEIDASLDLLAATAPGHRELYGAFRRFSVLVAEACVRLRIPQPPDHLVARFEPN